MSSEKNEKKLKRGQRPEGWKNDCAKFKEYFVETVSQENVCNIIASF